MRRFVLVNADNWALRSSAREQTDHELIAKTNADELAELNAGLARGDPWDSSDNLDDP